jgi:phosphoribosylformylglycinamidine synthase
MKYPYLFIFPNEAKHDIKGLQLPSKAKLHLGLDLQPARTGKVYVIAYPLEQAQILGFGEHCLRDRVTEDSSLNQIPSSLPGSQGIAIAKLAGVTDDEGISAQTALSDFCGLGLDLNTQHIFTQEIYLLEEGAPLAKLEELAKKLLANPLIHHIQFFGRDENGHWDFQPFVPEVKLGIHNKVQTVEIANLGEQALLQLSKERLMALNLAEMQAIQAYYQSATTQQIRQSQGLPTAPTDCELEILAQTWSEHCKHKEFNATIHYHNQVTGEQKTIESIFKTYIKGATDKVAQSLKNNDNHWLIKVFSDNAGVVKASDKWLFVWKVETHNSPSALDPYGGAITGILGNNRDPFGTGVGGARLLFNTNVLCFGPPTYDKPLLTGQLHPRRIMEGVIAGIEDGGNKSGVPTVNGAIVFDDRFSGKPLVYCGTGGIMPHQYQGLNTWEKRIDPQDRIIMAGGRVGKDGIHGATFSSLEIDEHAPASAVQIGSPITQKKLYDFLVIACEKGLVKCSTDNGAGGLSSSIGELAQITGGAEVYLEKVPLKYAGLRPWEIFVSESQERMTLVVEPKHWEALSELAQHMEVELSDIGQFTDSGFLDIRFGEQKVALLEMHFLHEGTPKKVLEAVWAGVEQAEPQPTAFESVDFNQTLLQLMGSWNVCSKEAIIRKYDHEVKGRTLIKPLMGKRGKAPQDAALVRLDWETHEAIAVSNGILPRYGDIDAYEMSKGAFDEAVRQIVAVGGSLPNQSKGDDLFWSVNDNFCVPDSVFDPQHNPDGKEKLAKLVQICEGLYEMATYFDIPLTSGKDSMKNDFRADGQKISVPPTILYSMTAKIPDFRKTCTAEFKLAGDLVYQLGETYEEFGGSEWFSLLGVVGNSVPKVRKEQAKALYQLVYKAHQQGLLASCHDLSDGGLAVAVAEACFGGGLGARLSLDKLKCSPQAALFAESHSRFVVSVAPQHQAAFEALFAERAFFLGQVQEQGQVLIQHQEQVLVNVSIQALEEAWTRPLR